MEKNLPSHQIDHYNLSSAQRRARLPAEGSAAALPAEQPGRPRGPCRCRGVPAGAARSFPGLRPGGRMDGTNPTPNFT